MFSLKKNTNHVLIWESEQTKDAHLTIREDNDMFSVVLKILASEKRGVENVPE